MDRDSNVLCEFYRVFVTVKSDTLFKRGEKVINRRKNLRHSYLNVVWIISHCI